MSFHSRSVKGLSARRRVLVRTPAGTKYWLEPITDRPSAAGCYETEDGRKKSLLPAVR